jgi:very-short-patch-repair endonuclease
MKFKVVLKKSKERNPPLFEAAGRLATPSPRPLSPKGARGGLGRENSVWRRTFRRRRAKGLGDCAGVLVLQPSPPWGRGCPGVPGRVRGSQTLVSIMTNGGLRRRSRSTGRSVAQITRARELRQTSTEAEQTAWRLLRTLRAAGFTFRRQHPVGKCVVDFCCPQKHLVLELDGSVHAQPSQARRDARRDRYLERLGYTVFRLPNGIVVSAPEEFVKRVLNRVSALPNVFAEGW